MTNQYIQPGSFSYACLRIAVVQRLQRGPHLLASRNDQRIDYVADCRLVSGLFVWRGIWGG